ncbi:MAG: hypothetical protein M3Q29_02945 [Chloroflexota bacterium]|nr:hypothetical protein [Chloroflexota bacterium]
MESDSLSERYQRAWDDLLGEEDIDELPELRHLVRVVPIAREVDTGAGALQFISLELYVEGCVLRYVLWLDRPVQPVDGDPLFPKSMLVFTDDLGTRYYGWPGSAWLEGGRSYDFWYRVPRPLDPRARRLQLEVREI